MMVIILLIMFKSLKIRGDVGSTLLLNFTKKLLLYLVGKEVLFVINNCEFYHNKYLIKMSQTETRSSKLRKISILTLELPFTYNCIDEKNYLTVIFSVAPEHARARKMPV